MTNYRKFLKTNVHDQLMAMNDILKNNDEVLCIMEQLTGQYRRSCNNQGRISDREECSRCIQHWLNAEADQPKPIRWQDAMMKNFLRKE